MHPTTRTSSLRVAPRVVAVCVYVVVLVAAGVRAGAPCALCVAAARGDAREAAALLATPSPAAATRVNAPDEDGVSAIHYAARGGHDDVLLELLRVDGVRVDKPMGVPGPTALHIAVAGGRVSTARLLLAAGARVDAVDPNGSTALHLAASRDDADLVRVLVGEGGAGVEVRGPGKRTPLQVAAAADAAAAVAALVASGADVGLHGAGVPPALGEAAAHGSARAVEELLKVRNIDVNAAASHGQTPLHMAASEGHARVVALLTMHASTKIDPRDEFNCTPLYWAAWQGHADIVSNLLMHGADAAVVDKWGHSAVAKAWEKRHVWLAARLWLHTAGMSVWAGVGVGGVVLSWVVLRATLKAKSD